MKTNRYLALRCAATIGLFLTPLAGSAALYDLRAVNGIEGFAGSGAARELLGKNGFVVADPVFRQIFEPYIKSPELEEPSENNPRGLSLPSFITTDSAWHTYHILLEEGVKTLEESQRGRLLAFSRRLLSVASQTKDGTVATDLAQFASVGLGLQDEQHRQALGPEEKRIVDGLLRGTNPVEVPVGFSLLPAQFCAQSFYTQSRDLSNYFVARQWYASVVFRLSNPRETKCAVALAQLVNGDAELLGLWKRLSEPFDTLLAAAEDGTVRDYAEVATAVSGNKVQTSPLTDDQVAEIRKRLEDRLPLPRLSDQFLSPAQYSEFSKNTQGFRLLPPRRLPCAVCFQNTVDPRIPNRNYPSGLDFLAASPVLRSPAAVRALESQFGKSVSDLILKADCGPMPDSLYGESMQLLATLQKPLSAQAPPALRTEAWSGLQLWTQLAAWAEMRHTWALHSKLTVSVSGIVTPPKGMVAPYPDFFAGLARLTRRTATAFETAGLEESFEVKNVASNLLALLSLSQAGPHTLDATEWEKNSAGFEQLNQFHSRYYDQHRREIDKARSRDPWRKLDNDLEDLARRCAATGTANETETATLRMFFDCRQEILRLLKDFAPVCDRLAELARKSLDGKPLTENDAQWIENYGVTLAGFHFYYGNWYEVPRDDFPIVMRVFANPVSGLMLYAGLARPQALYVIVPNGKSKQLYRGAVMTYREFARPGGQLLDDETWRVQVSSGQTPPAPPFTRSFCAETSVAELIKNLRTLRGREDVNFGDISDILWQIGSRASEKDLPELLKAMGSTKGEDSSEIVEGFAEIAARLPWESHKKELLELLASNDPRLADAAARIMADRPGSLDAAVFISAFNQQPVRTRRLYCAILSVLPGPSESTRKCLKEALRDQADGVRWQAALAIEKAKWNDAQSQAALLEALNDPNELVGAAAAHSLARLGATNAAPVLLARLQAALQSTNISAELLERQRSAVTRDIHLDANRSPAYQLLDPDNLESRISYRAPLRAKELSYARIPPQPVTFPTHDYGIEDALIEALGELGYTPAADEMFKLRGTDYDGEVTFALNQLAPERLTGELVATAKDQRVEGYLRERALVTLSTLSATNRARDLVPLLDDPTPIVYARNLPGPEWRICDRTAATIALMLGWQDRRVLRYVPASQRVEMLKRAREWAKSPP